MRRRAPAIRRAARPAPLPRSAKTVACALALALTATPACGGSPAQPPPPPAPPAPPLAIVGPPAGNAVTALDPDTLAPRGPRADLGEYHDAWAFSPDGARVAFGISASGRTGRVAIRVLDRGSLRVTAEIDASAAAQAVGWLSPDLIAAYTIPHYMGAAGRLQEFPGEIVLADADTGELLARRPFRAPAACPPAAAVTPAGFAVLVSGPRLAILDAGGRYRTVRLRLPSRVRDGACGGVAVDPEGARAFVVAAGAPVAEVDLRTLAVRYPASGVPPVSRRCRRNRGRCVPRRSALWLGDDRLAVSGEDHFGGLGRSGHEAAGARLVGVGVVGRGLDSRAARVRLAGDTLLTFDSPGRGLRGFGLDGTERFRRFHGRRAADVQVSGGRVYARVGGTVHELDPATGATLARPSSAPRRFELLDPPP